MKLSSPAFVENQKIPVKYTCRGEGISPALDITEIPEGTQSLSLILKDPDAPSGTFIHYVVWNISPDTKNIPENATPSGSVVGTNTAGRNIFVSPCPPQGQHHYIYYLYALDTTLTLPPEASSGDMESVMAGHILGSTTLTGVFP